MRCISKDNQIAIDTPNTLNKDPQSFIKLKQLIEDIRKQKIKKEENASSPTFYSKPTLALDIDQTLVYASTKVLEGLEEMLTINMENDTQLHVYKRPFLTQFLTTMAQYFRLVIFTASASFYAQHIAAILDPSATLFEEIYDRQSCSKYDQYYIKNLDILNVDLRQVVLVDDSISSMSWQLENGVLVRAWKGKRSDKCLLKLIPHLKSLSELDDVRIRGKLACQYLNQIQSETQVIQMGNCSCNESEHQLMASGQSTQRPVTSISAATILYTALAGYQARKIAATMRKALHEEILPQKDKTLVLFSKISDEARHILSKLGTFVYDDASDDEVEVEERPMTDAENGSTYLGEWSITENVRHGRGTMVFANGALFEGHWRNGRASGKGRHIHADGDYYEGNWKDDMVSGLGILVHANGSKFEGEWSMDKQNGWGIESWPDGAQFEGHFVDGQKNGRGKFVWKDRSCYEGEFSRNKLEGKGVYIWSDGRKFIGSWVANKMHGSGIFTWPDGRCYEGEYQNDKKHGIGTYTWSDSKKYEGEWIDGKQCGIGIYYSAENNFQGRKGEWSGGKRIRWIEQIIILTNTLCQIN